MGLGDQRKIDAISTTGGSIVVCVCVCVWCHSLLISTGRGTCYCAIGNAGSCNL